MLKLIDTHSNEDVYKMVRSGLLDKMSFAFHVKESSYEYTEREGEPTIELRTITEIDKLYDVSAVDIPAYDTTSISARGAFDAERERRAEEIIKHEEEIKVALAKFDYLEV